MSQFIRLSKTKKIAYIISWIPVLLLQTFPVLLLAPLYKWMPLPLLAYGAPVGLRFLGVVMVPLGLVLTRGKMNGIFWLWGNDEEGCPDRWLDKMAKLTINPDDEWHQRAVDRLRRMFPRFWWYAIRNSLGNFRFLFKDYPLDECYVHTNWVINQPMEAKQMRIAGVRKAWMWVAKGWKAGYRVVWLEGHDRYSERWYGWKVGGETVPGCGFTWQRRTRIKDGK